MFGRKNNSKKSDGTGTEAAQGTVARTYALEAIMGLQKVLENGLEEPEPVPEKKDQRAPQVDSSAAEVSTGWIERLREPLADAITRLGYPLPLILKRRRQAKRTSAR